MHGHSALWVQQDQPVAARAAELRVTWLSHLNHWWLRSDKQAAQACKQQRTCVLSTVPDCIYRAEHGKRGEGKTAFLKL